MSSQKRLKIAYLCETDPKHTWAHSGGNTRIFNALQKHVGDVSVLPSSWGILEFLRRFIHSLPLNIQLRLRFRTHLFLSRFISKHIEKIIANEKYDVVFCAYSFFCLSYLKLPENCISVFSSDATYTAYKNSQVGAAFGSYFSLSRRLDPLILKAEKRVYSQIDLCLWPSQWIKDAADRLYSLDDSHSKVVNWGAGVAPPVREELILDNPIEDEVRLLLVGRDWVPKGGPMVYDILNILVGRGVNAHLTVVGCEPPKHHIDKNMTVYKQLDKTNPEQLEKFTALYKNAHFFVMPSYEAYGFAFCEAGAYALPSLCLKVGGVPIVEFDRDAAVGNGHALDADVDAVDFVNKIEHYLNTPKAYSEFRRSTRDYYEQHLNWDAWGKKVSALIDEKIEDRN